MIICCNADVNISHNGKANVRNSLIHILNCCIICCYIMTSMWWTFSLQPNQMRLWWKSDAFVGRWRNRTCLWNRTRLWVLHICMLKVSILPVSKIFLLDFRTVMMVWHFLFIILLHWFCTCINPCPKANTSTLSILIAVFSRALLTLWGVYTIPFAFNADKTKPKR